ncbi:relaxase domain-containing protein [Oculatella sp. LEGE 06141]|uniref:MobF family relaxase n=1 Tax=Oculatella sp. LEGE 06141 TaxID=1828648 RepID=UPI0018815A65|nr:MobF family relaxase [Oculatella sp. LEGE 06141]MBE9182519.1 relaxase domain-containing protein [Oculatella sp. LEGE 06141]
MMTIKNLSASQAESYYEKDDYYTSTESSANTNLPIRDSQWFGTGAIALGLQGEVDSSDFKQLLHGYSPEGQRLHAKRINPRTHRAGTDYTLSAPKSVSIAALIQGDRRVVAAHNQAVGITLSILEQRFSRTRISNNGTQVHVHTGNIIAATFRHHTNREQEPQLHTHCVVMNATQRSGRWQSMSNEAVFIHQKLLGQIYQNELAYQLQQVGYEITPLANGQFELAGYSQEVRDSYSTRRKEIKAYLANVEETLNRTPSAHQREQAALRTRRNKAKAIARDVLQQNWLNMLDTHNLALPPIPEPEVNPKLQPNQLRAIALIDEAIRHLSEPNEELDKATNEEPVEELNEEPVEEPDRATNEELNEEPDKATSQELKRRHIERFMLEHHLGQYPFHILQAAIQSNRELIPLPSDPETYITQSALQREPALQQLLEPVQVPELPELPELPEPNNNLNQNATSSTQLYWITPHAKTSQSIEITIRRDRLRAKRLRISLDPNLGSRIGERVAQKLRAALNSTRSTQRSPGETGTTLPSFANSDQSAQPPFCGINLDPNLGSRIGERVAQKLRAALNSARPDQRSPGEIGTALPSFAVSSPPTQAPQPDEQPDLLSKEQQDYVNRILPVIRTIWERVKTSRPSLSQITFENYRIQVSDSDQPELYRYQQQATSSTEDKILEWTAVGYRGYGLTQKDCEAIERLVQQLQARRHHQQMLANQQAQAKIKRKRNQSQMER